MTMMAQSFTLPCGAVLPNRLCKAAMTDGLADENLNATERHFPLYTRWAEGGARPPIPGNLVTAARGSNDNVPVMGRPAPPSAQRR